VVEASIPAPSTGCPIDRGWSTSARLPDGFTGNGGLALAPCEFLLVGDVIDRITLAQEAVVVTAEFGEVDIEAGFGGRTFWDVARASNGDIWVAGEGPGGSGFLVRRVGSGWETVEVPTKVGWIYRILWANDRLYLAAVAAQEADLWTLSLDGEWTLRLAVRSPTNERVPAPEAASIKTIAVAGADVLVGGTDGYNGFVVRSHDAGETFAPEGLPDGLVSSVTSIVGLSGEVAVAGYLRVGAEDYSAVLALDDHGTWREITMPQDAGRILDAAAADDVIYAVAEFPDGDAVLAVSGEQVRTDEVQESGLIRLIPPADSVLAAIGRDLYARSLP